MTDDKTFVDAIAEQYNIQKSSVIYQYIKRKTKAADRGSKARRSLGNLYALFVLCEDFLQEKQGSSFTELMARMKALPFGAKLQNHPLDNRLNDEVRRQYSIEDNMLPVQPVDLGDGKKARTISINLLSEKGLDPFGSANFIVESISTYINIIDDNQTEYLKEIESSTNKKDILHLIRKSFEYNSDARLFEIVSFGLLFLHYRETLVTFIVNGERTTDPLTLYRTGRTNANDGGIDFVLKPLGKFFQVTETLDFKKYFLDFDKMNRFPLSFVIKTSLSSKEVKEQIGKDAMKKNSHELAEKYMQLFDEIYTLNELDDILKWISNSEELILELKSIIVNAFKIEYGLLD